MSTIYSTKYRLGRGSCSVVNNYKSLFYRASENKTFHWKSLYHCILIDKNDDGPKRYSPFDISVEKILYSPSCVELKLLFVKTIIILYPLFAVLLAGIESVYKVQIIENSLTVFKFRCFVLVCKKYTCCFKI